MKKVEFLFNKEKDLWNHWDKANWSEKQNIGNFKINKEIKKICYKKKFNECKKKLSLYLQRIHNSDYIPITLEAVEKAWKKIEKEFFKRMDKLMKHTYDLNIKAYLTTYGVCPYNPDEPSFMFSLYYPIPGNVITCAHEIMHLYFHKFYWNDVEKEIGEKKTWDLKEALTILLNHEFKDLWFILDEGYEVHKELREFISKQWKKEKDFDVLIKKCVEKYKE